jgi:hypothetical protein
MPAPPTQTEIANTLDAPMSIWDAIEELKKERSVEKAKLMQSLATDLAANPINVDNAVQNYKNWKANDDSLAGKIEACEEVGVLISKRIEELKDTTPEAMAAVLEQKIEELGKESAQEKDKAAFLKKRIDQYKALLSELEKSEKKEQATAKKA